MNSTNEPIDAINEWQEWYRSYNSINTETTSPVTVTDLLTESKAKEIYFEKAKEHFADTLAEFQYELTGKELYKAFYAAAIENMEAAEKEYKRTKELIDMLRYSNG
jgi:hypothetical protein